MIVVWTNHCLKSMNYTRLIGQLDASLFSPRMQPLLNNSRTQGYIARSLELYIIVSIHEIKGMKEAKLS